MGRIKIDVGAVVGAGDQANVASNKVKSASDSVHNVRQYLDPRIKWRSGIDNSLLSLKNRLDAISYKIRRIQTTTDLGANRYRQSDALLNAPNAMSGREMLGIIDTALRTELASKFNVFKDMIDDARENLERWKEEVRANRDPLPSLREYTLVYDFIDSQSEWGYAILYAITRGDTLTGVKSYWNSYFGRDDMNDTIFKNHIKKTIALTIDEESNADLGKELLREASQGADAVNLWNKIVEAVEKGGEKYKYLKYMDKDSFDNLGKLLSYGQEGIECFEIMVSDYSESIAKLTILKEGLIQSGCDEEIIAYVDEIIYEYNNKFSTITGKLADFVMDQSITAGVDGFASSIPGGQLFVIASASQKLIWSGLGIEAKGDQLADICASCCYSGYVVEAYEFYAHKLRTGNYTAEDVEKCEALFEIAKEMKIQEYNDIRDFSHSDMYEEIDEAIDNLTHSRMLSERF